MEKWSNSVRGRRFFADRFFSSRFGPFGVLLAKFFPNRNFGPKNNLEKFLAMTSIKKNTSLIIQKEKYLQVVAFNP